MTTTLQATLVHRAGRTFKVEWTHIGEVRGWGVFEHDLEPGITWSCVSGAHRIKDDAYRDIDRMLAV